MSEDKMPYQRLFHFIFDSAMNGTKTEQSIPKSIIAAWVDMIFSWTFLALCLWFGASVYVIANTEIHPDALLGLFAGIYVGGELSEK